MHIRLQISTQRKLKLRRDIFLLPVPGADQGGVAEDPFNPVPWLDRPAGFRTQAGLA
jgi:hypothetical protein